MEVKVFYVDVHFVLQKKKENASDFLRFLNRLIMLVRNSAVFFLQSRGEAKTRFFLLRRLFSLLKHSFPTDLRDEFTSQKVLAHQAVSFS